MSLNIVANIPLFTKLTHILTHYFPHQSNPTQTSATNANNNNIQPKLLSLLINTKYYTCKVPITHSIPSQSTLQQQKIQCMIFLFDEHEDIPNIKSLIDTQINKSDVQSVIICVNKTTNNIQNNQKEWKYKDEIGQCDNFLSIVYQDLDKIMENMPNWNNNGGGLLKQQEQQYQIFAILELLATTTWTNVIKKQIQSTHNKTLKNTKKQNNTTSQQIKQRKPQQILKQKQQQKIQDRQQQEYDQQKLERQMQQFQQMMQQMLLIKAMPIHGDQRKKKAGDLLMKLAANMVD